MVKSQPAILGTGGAEEQVCRKFWNTQKRCSVLEQNWHPNSVSSHGHRALGSEEDTHPRWSAEGSSSGADVGRGPVLTEADHLLISPDRSRNERNLPFLSQGNKFRALLQSRQGLPPSPNKVEPPLPQTDTSLWNLPCECGRGIREKGQKLSGD